MSWSFFKRFRGTNVKFCFAEELVRWLFAKLPDLLYCRDISDLSRWYYPVQMRFMTCRSWSITEELHYCAHAFVFCYYALKTSLVPVCYLKRIGFGDQQKRGRIELHPIWPLHGAFPSAFPAVDGSLFHSLPVVALFDKYIVTEGGVNARRTLPWRFENDGSRRPNRQGDL